MTALYWKVVERDAMAYRRMWLIFLTGFAEPLFFLLSIGIGVGHLVGGVHGPGGVTVDYQDYVAPGLLAAGRHERRPSSTPPSTSSSSSSTPRASAAMLATPLGTGDVARGELAWSLLRGTTYSGVFLLTMALLGLTASPWAVLALPAAALIGFGFAGVGMAATTWMRSFVDFDYVNLALIPLFLFSGTFFPLSQYPAALQWSRAVHAAVPGSRSGASPWCSATSSR